MNEQTTVLERVRALLDSCAVTYELMEHAPVFTSEEAARVRGTDIREGAKALLFLADGRPVLLVVPGDRRVDSRAFKQRFGVQDLRLVAAAELRQLTGLAPGAVPPFGSVMGLPTYVDAALATGQRMAFNAGSHSASIRMAVADFLAVERAIVEAFSR
jgi:Ala-tRNA(Pro) deacylase